MLLVLSTLVVILGKSELYSGIRWNLKTSSPDSTFILFYLKIKSSLAFNFLHPVMFTFLRFRQKSVSSLRLSPVIFVLPTSISSRNVSSFARPIMPSSFNAAHPKKHNLRSREHFASFVTPLSVM